MEENPKKEGKYDTIKRASGVIFLLICGCALIIGLISDFQKNSSDSLDFTSDKGIIYREAKYIFGSVINKDAILLMRWSEFVRQHGGEISNAPGCWECRRQAAVFSFSSPSK